MNCKDKIKMMLWNLGLRETIPASVINSVHIKENNEELVDIKQDKKLYFSDELQQRSAVYLRKSVYENIKKAQNALPSNYFFKVYSAFRPHEEQIQLWNKNYQEIKANNPTLSEQEIVNKTKAVCADPRFGFGGHQTGGAVDITLCDALGKDYDMGTAYLEVSSKTPTKSNGLTDEQKLNRSILKNSMENAGFKNYPHEWWHFCYGDRMWGAYSKRKDCFYGMPTQNGR